MLVSDVLYAAPIENLTPSVSAKEALFQDPQRFEAPLDYSMLKDVRCGEKKTFIIHIQDAHSNLSGQQNLAGALDELMKRYDVSLVLVEGGTRDDSLTPLKKLASPEVWKQVAKKFLMEGKISGEEYLNLTSERPMKIMGIEDKELYWHSLRAYDRLAAKREAILLQSKKLRNALEKLKNKFYPPELKEYEALKERQGEAGDSAFEERFEKLIALAEKNEKTAAILKSFSNTQRLLEIQRSEKDIDFNAANLEQAALLEELAKRGAAGDVRAALSRLSTLKNSRLSQLNFIESLLRGARERSVSLDAYPNLPLYEKYLQSFLGVDFEKLLDESERLEDEVYRVSLPAEDARLVRSIDRYIGLLDTAYRIQMSTKEFELFKLNEPDFSTAAYLAFVNRKLADLGYFDDLLPMQDIFEEAKSALTDFYTSVSRRDEAFMRNAERILSEEKQQVAVLIAGGYHTSNLKKLFSEKDYSYAVLAPIVTGETNQKKYEKILLEPIRKDIATVETMTDGTGSSDKPLSALEEDLQSLKRKSDGIRAEATAENGARLAEVMQAVGSRDNTAIAESALNLLRPGTSKKPVEVPQGARLADTTSVTEDGLTISRLQHAIDDYRKKIVSLLPEYDKKDHSVSSGVYLDELKAYLTLMQNFFSAVEKPERPLTVIYPYSGPDPVFRALRDTYSLTFQVDDFIGADGIMRWMDKSGLGDGLYERFKKNIKSNTTVDANDFENYEDLNIDRSQGPIVFVIKGFGWAADANEIKKAKSTMKRILNEFLKPGDMVLILSGKISGDIPGFDLVKAAQKFGFRVIINEDGFEDNSPDHSKRFLRSSRGPIMIFPDQFILLRKEGESGLKKELGLERESGPVQTWRQALARIFDFGKTKTNSDVVGRGVSGARLSTVASAKVELAKEGLNAGNLAGQTPTLVSSLDIRGSERRTASSSDWTLVSRLSRRVFTSVMSSLRELMSSAMTRISFLKDSTKAATWLGVKFLSSLGLDTDARLVPDSGFVKAPAASRGARLALPSFDYAKELASDGIIEALGLREADVVEHTRPTADLDVYKIRVKNEKLEAGHFAEKLQILRQEFGEEHENFYLIFNQKGELIAIQAAEDPEKVFFVAPLNIPVALLQALESPSNGPEIKIFSAKIRRDFSGLKKFWSRMGWKRPWYALRKHSLESSLNSFSPFEAIKVDLSSGELAAQWFDFNELAEAAAWLRRKRFKEEASAFLPRYSTVYSPAQNLTSDQLFHKAVYQNFLAIKELHQNKNAMDAGTGTGIAVWLQWLASRKRGNAQRIRLHAYDINPLAVANADLFLRRMHDIDVDLRVSGNPEIFGDMTVDYMTTNSPAYHSILKSTRSATRAEHFYDYGKNGTQFAENLAEYLKGHLAPLGWAVIWNASQPEDTSDRTVLDVFNEAGLEFRPIAVEDELVGILSRKGSAVGARLAEEDKKPGRITRRKLLLGITGTLMAAGTLLNSRWVEEAEESSERVFLAGDYDFKIVPADDPTLQKVRSGEFRFVSTINFFRRLSSEKQVIGLLKVDGKEVHEFNPNRRVHAEQRVLAVIDNGLVLHEDLNPKEATLLAHDSRTVFQAGPLAVSGGKVNEGLWAWYRGILNGRTRVLGVDAAGNWYSKEIYGPDIFGVFGRSKHDFQKEIRGWVKENRIKEALFVDGGSAGIGSFDLQRPPYILVASRKSSGARLASNAQKTNREQAPWESMQPMNSPEEAVHFMAAMRDALQKWGYPHMDVIDEYLEALSLHPVMMSKLLRPAGKTFGKNGLIYFHHSPDYWNQRLIHTQERASETEFIRELVLGLIIEAWGYRLLSRTQDKTINVSDRLQEMSSTSAGAGSPEFRRLLEQKVLDRPIGETFEMLKAADFLSWASEKGRYIPSSADEEMSALEDYESVYRNGLRERDIFYNLFDGFLLQGLTGNFVGTDMDSPWRWFVELVLRGKLPKNSSERKQVARNLWEPIGKNIFATYRAAAESGARLAGATPAERGEIFAQAQELTDYLMNNFSEDMQRLPNQMTTPTARLFIKLSKSRLNLQYLSHGPEFVVFTSPKYPRLVFKMPKKNDRRQFWIDYVERLENIAQDSRFSKEEVKRSVDGFVLIALPGLVPTSVIGDGLIVQQKAVVTVNDDPLERGGDGWARNVLKNKIKSWGGLYFNAADENEGIVDTRQRVVVDLAAVSLPESASGARLAKSSMAPEEFEKLKGVARNAFVDDLGNPLLDELDDPEKIITTKNLTNYLVEALADRYEKLRREYIDKVGKKDVPSREEVRQIFIASMNGDESGKKVHVYSDRLVYLHTVFNDAVSPFSLYDMEPDHNWVSSVVNFFSRSVLSLSEKLSPESRAKARQRFFGVAMGKFDNHHFWSKQDRAMGYLMLVRLSPDLMDWAGPLVQQRLDTLNDPAAVRDAVHRIMAGKLKHFKSFHEKDPEYLSEEDLAALHLNKDDGDLTFALQLLHDTAVSIKESGGEVSAHKEDLEPVLKKALEFFPGMPEEEKKEMRDQGITPLRIALFAAKWAVEDYDKAYSFASPPRREGLSKSIEPQVSIYFNVSRGRDDEEAALYALEGAYRVHTAFMALMDLFKDSQSAGDYYRLLARRLNFKNIDDREGFSRVMENMASVLADAEKKSGYSKRDKAAAYLIALLLIPKDQKETLSSIISEKIRKLGADALVPLEWVMAQPNAEDKRYAEVWYKEIAQVAGLPALSAEAARPPLSERQMVQQASALMKDPAAEGNLRYFIHGTEVGVFTSNDLPHLVIKYPRSGDLASYRERLLETALAMQHYSGLSPEKIRKVVDGWELWDIPGVAPFLITESGLLLQERADPTANLEHDLSDARRALSEQLTEYGVDFRDVDPNNVGLFDSQLKLLDLGAVRITEYAKRMLEFSKLPEGDPTLWIYSKDDFAVKSARLIAARIGTFQSRNKTRNVNVIIAVGNTQEAMLDALSQDTSIDWSRVEIFQLAEYKDKPSSDPSSAAYKLKTTLLDKLKQRGVTFPTGKTGRLHLINDDSDPRKHLELLSQRGGADIAVLGIGENGHIGFNEPLSSFEDTIREVELSPETAKGKDVEISKAITYGIGDLFGAKEVWILANTAEKKEALKRAIDGPIDEEDPASIFRKHPRANYILSQEAVPEGLRGARLAGGRASLGPNEDIERLEARIQRRTKGNYSGEDAVKVEKLIKEAKRFYDLPELRGKNQEQMLYREALLIARFLLEWKQDIDLIRLALYLPARRHISKAKIGSLEAKLKGIADADELQMGALRVLAIPNEGDFEADTRSLANYLNLILKLIHVPGSSGSDSRSLHLLMAAKLANFILYAEERGFTGAQGMDIRDPALNEMLQVYSALADKTHLGLVADTINSHVYRRLAPGPYFDLISQKVNLLAGVLGRDQARKVRAVLSEFKDRFPSMNRRINSLSDMSWELTQEIERSFDGEALSTVLMDQGVDSAEISFRVKSDASVFEKIYIRKGYKRVSDLHDLTGIIVTTSSVGVGLAINALEESLQSRMKMSPSVDFKTGDQVHLDFHGSILRRGGSRDVSMEAIVMTEARYREYRYGTVEEKSRYQTIISHPEFRSSRRSSVFNFNAKEKAALPRFRPSEDLDDVYDSIEKRRYVLVYVKNENRHTLTKRVLELSDNASVGDLLFALDLSPAHIYFSNGNNANKSLSQTDLNAPVSSLEVQLPGRPYQSLYIIKQEGKGSLGPWIKDVTGRKADPKKKKVIDGNTLKMVPSILKYSVMLAGTRPAGKVFAERLLNEKVKIEKRKTVDGLFVKNKDGSYQRVDESKRVADLLGEIEVFAQDAGFTGYDMLFRAIQGEWLSRETFLREFEAYVSSRHQKLPSLDRSSGARLAQTPAEELRSMISSIRHTLIQREQFVLPNFLKEMFPEDERAFNQQLALVEAFSENKEMKFSQDEKDVIRRAYLLAFAAHTFFPKKPENKYRRMKGLQTLYIVHPVGVAKTLIEEFAPIVRGTEAQVDAVAVTVALLHDIFEDTTLSRLSQYDLMRLLKTKEDEFMSAWNMIRDLSKRDGDTGPKQYQRLIQSIEDDPYRDLGRYFQVLLIKLSDKLDSTVRDHEMVKEHPEILKKNAREILAFLDGRRYFTKHFVNYIYRTGYPEMQRASLYWYKRYHETEQAQRALIAEKPYGAELLKGYPKRLYSANVSRVPGTDNEWKSNGFWGQGTFKTEDITSMSETDRDKFFREQWPAVWAYARAAYPPVTLNDWLKDPENLKDRVLKKKDMRMVVLFDQRNGSNVPRGVYLYDSTHNDLDVISVDEDLRGTGATHVLLADFRERIGGLDGKVNLATLSIDPRASLDEADEGHFGVDVLGNSIERALHIGDTVRIDRPSGARLADGSSDKGSLEAAFTENEARLKEMYDELGGMVDRDEQTYNFGRFRKLRSDIDDLNERQDEISGKLRKFGARLANEGAQNVRIVMHRWTPDALRVLFEKIIKNKFITDQQIVSPDFVKVIYEGGMDPWTLEKLRSKKGRSASDNFRYKKNDRMRYFYPVPDEAWSREAKARYMLTYLERIGNLYAAKLSDDWSNPANKQNNFKKIAAIYSVNRQTRFIHSLVMNAPEQFYSIKVYSKGALVVDVQARVKKNKKTKDSKDTEDTRAIQLMNATGDWETVYQRPGGTAIDKRVRQEYHILGSERLALVRFAAHLQEIEQIIERIELFGTLVPKAARPRANRSREALERITAELAEDPEKIVEMKSGLDRAVLPQRKRIRELLEGAATSISQEQYSEAQQQLRGASTRLTKEIERVLGIIDHFVKKKSNVMNERRRVSGASPEQALARRGARLAGSTGLPLRESVVSSQGPVDREGRGEDNGRFAVFYGARLATAAVLIPAGEFPMLLPMGGAPTMVGSISSVQLTEFIRGSKLAVAFVPEKSQVVRDLASQEMAEQVALEARQIRSFDGAFAQLGISKDSLEGVIGVDMAQFNPESLPILKIAVSEIETEYRKVRFYFMGSDAISGVSKDVWENEKDKRIVISGSALEDAGYEMIERASEGRAHAARPMLHYAAYLLGLRNMKDPQGILVPDNVVSSVSQMAGNPAGSSLNGQHIVGFAKGLQTPELLAVAQTYRVRAAKWVDATIHDYLTALQAVGQSA